ncbi:hypothetical protein LXL04_029575 [Taraxacum kok-saghyz]
MFVFLKPADNETSARPLRGTNLDHFRLKPFFFLHPDRNFTSIFFFAAADLKSNGSNSPAHQRRLRDRFSSGLLRDRRRLQQVRTELLFRCNRLFRQSTFYCVDLCSTNTGEVDPGLKTKGKTLILKETTTEGWYLSEMLDLTGVEGREGLFLVSFVVVDD